MVKVIPTVEQMQERAESLRLDGRRIACVPTMGFLHDKKILITGVASDRSIASGTAEAMAREGAQLAFTYQNEKLQKRVAKAAEAQAAKFGVRAESVAREHVSAMI